jgi:hypothetical protein
LTELADALAKEAARIEAGEREERHIWALSGSREVDQGSGD